MIALLEAHRAGLLSRSHWLRNILAGLVVGVVALPLSMAFAIASGARPEHGLYTAIVAGFIVSVAGGSRVQIAGPTGAFVVILSSVTAQYGYEGLQIATFMAGAILLVFGLVRLGAIIRFIPDPVIVGFTAGIAVIIWVGQWANFFGLRTDIPATAHFHKRVAGLLINLPHLDIPTLFYGATALALVLLTPRIPHLRRVPGMLIALILLTVVQAASQLPAVQAIHPFPNVPTIGSVYGDIPRNLPPVHWPDLSHMLELIGPAFTIAMLGAIESLLSAVVADGMTDTRHDSNQELIGQGIANLATPLLGGFAATGALARTATNIRTGGNSPLAGIVHTVLLLFIVLTLAPYAIHVPLAVLAAILFVVAWNMGEAHRFLAMVHRAPRADVAILLLTFFLTVFADLVVAVNIGVIVAVLHFLRRMASSVEVREMDANEVAEEFAAHHLTLPPGVLVYAVEGPFFFGAVENFERALAYTHTDPQVLIIRLRWVPFIDITGLQTLEGAIRDLHRRGVRVMLTGANPRVQGKLEKAGITPLIGPHNLFPSLPAALRDVSSDAAKTG